MIDQQLCEDQNARLSFEAICNIHKVMDDDTDGTVDTDETDEVSGKHVMRVSRSRRRSDP